MSFLSICPFKNIGAKRKRLPYIPSFKYSAFSGRGYKGSIVKLNIRFCSNTNESTTRRKRKKNYTYINRTINNVNETKQVMDKKGKDYFFDRFSDDFETHSDGYATRMYGIHTAKKYDLVLLREIIANKLGVVPRWVGQRKVKNTLYCRISGHDLVDLTNIKDAKQLQQQQQNQPIREREFFWFKDGVMVTYGSSDSDINFMRRIIKIAEIEPLAKPYYDEMTYQYNGRSGIDFDTDIISLTSFDSFLEKLTCSYCLQRSLRLEYLEDIIDEIGKDISTRASEFFLIHGSSITSKGAVGIINVKQQIFTQAEVFTIFGNLLRITSDLNDDELKYPPEYLWDSPQFERLYESLQKSFMLRSRFNSANESLEASKKDIELIRDHFNVNHSFRLELIIIVLIFFEVMMTLLEKSETYSEFTWGKLYRFIKDMIFKSI